MFRFIHAADIHLDSPLRGLERYEGAPAEQIRAGSRRALERLVSLALSERVDFLLIAGDIYDGNWPDHNTGLFFVKQMARLAEQEIPVILISGNHDAESKMTRSLRLPPHVIRLDAQRPETARCDRLSDLRVAVHGQSFAHPKVVENLALAYPAAVSHWYNIGLLHTSLTGSEQHDSYAPCTVGDLERLRYDYWALGHIHKREAIAAQSVICFPGNLQGRSIRETGAKGCQLVKVDDQGQTHSEFVPLDVMRWEHCRVERDEPGELDDWLVVFQQQLNQLQERHAGLPLALRVTFAGAGLNDSTFGDDWRQVIQEVRGAAITETNGNCWIEKVIRQVDRSAQHQAADRIDWDQGPWAEVLRIVAAGQTDDALCQEWKESLADLSKQLPAELTKGPEPLMLDQLDWLRSVAASLPAELARRLQPGGEP